MKRLIFFLAVLAATLVISSCTKDDNVGNQNPDEFTVEFDEARAIADKFAEIQRGRTLTFRGDTTGAS